MTQRCPVCASLYTADGISLDPSTGQLQWSGGEAHLGFRHRRLVALLLKRVGRLVSKEAIIEALWFDDPNGGPENITNGINVIVCHTRRRLSEARFPGEIAAQFASGYSLELKTVFVAAEELEPVD